MRVDERTPVLVGGGQFLYRADGIADALDPIALMSEASHAAAADAGLTAVPPVDSVRVVAILSWRHGNPAHLLAQQLGLTPRELAVTTMGGNSPQSLVNVTAAEIQRGDIDIALLAGGEAWRTRMRARRTGAHLDWPKAPADVPQRTIGDDLVMNHDAETSLGITMPVQVYPMFETAVRAVAGRDVTDHQEAIARLWARFSEVGAANPFAWSRTARTPAEIATPGPTNRMIGLPYTKLMNSNNDVDMAAAVIMCSVGAARRLGISQDRWVFVHAGADCHEHQYVSNRLTFSETPAIRIGGRAALDVAGIGIDDVAVVDLYSCFPSAVELGAQSLGLALDGSRQLTRTGGLQFAGGPWNNYVMHAIATVITDLRERPGDWGLVWANGGYTTRHSFGVYSASPPASGFRAVRPQDAIDGRPRREVAEGDDATGPATIEAYTVMHSRDGAPETSIVACLLPDGRRTWGTSSDPTLVREMGDGEWVGRAVTLPL